MLGWIDPGLLPRRPADARRRGRRAASLRASRTPLGMSVEEAAYAALTIATENIVGAIREITIAQGIDPREVHAGRRRRRLRASTSSRSRASSAAGACCCPSTAGALSACGALFADVDLGVLAQPLRRDALARPRRRERGARRHRGARRRVPRRARRARPVADAQGLLGRGALPRAGLGARRARPEPQLETARTCAALEEAFHDDARAHLRRARARPVPGVPALEGARDGRARASPPCTRATRRDRPRRAARIDGARVLPRDRARARCPATTASRCRAARASRARRSIREPTTTIVVYPGSTATVTRARQLPARVDCDGAGRRPSALP